MDGFVETATRDRRIDFDLQIVATMKANRVGHIYTFNTSDFENFEELTVIEPSEASSRPVY